MLGTSQCGTFSRRVTQTVAVVVLFGVCASSLQLLGRVGSSANEERFPQTAED